MASLWPGGCCRAPAEAASDLRLAGWPETFGSFNGNVDEVRIYDQALSASDIAG